MPQMKGKKLNKSAVRKETDHFTYNNFYDAMECITGGSIFSLKRFVQMNQPHMYSLSADP